MLSHRKMLMCANGACHFRVNKDSACGGYCCKWCHVSHALQLCPPERGQTCERQFAPSGAFRAQPRPPDGHLSTNNQNFEKRRTRPALDLATVSTAGNKLPELRMSKRGRSEIQVPLFSQHTHAASKAKHGGTPRQRWTETSLLGAELS